MKAVGIFLGALLLLLGAMLFLAPATGKAFLSRAAGYLDPEPVVEAPSPPAPGAVRAAPPPPPEPEWRKKDREAWRAYEAGEFPVAAATWRSAASMAQANDAVALRRRASRANLFGLLASRVPPAEGLNPAADEAEVRKRIEAVTSPSSSAWMDVADFAASHGLRHHLAFLYERASALRHAPGGDGYAKAVKNSLEVRKASGEPPPPEVLDAVIEELPTSEAADEARADTGGGFGGVEKRGEHRPGDVVAVDPERLAEARRLMDKGIAEYKLAVPGTAQVNTHRRAALDAFIKARTIYESLDGGRGSFSKAIHDCNQNIAELRKDLPVGK